MLTEGSGRKTGPGFSSPTDVHISLKRFSDIDHDARNDVLVVGAGSIWGDVYVLDPPREGAAGSRVTGVRNCLLALKWLEYTIDL
jgi:hypothetical protein